METLSGKSTNTMSGKIDGLKMRWHRRAKMKFLSEMDKPRTRSPVHHFSCERTALEHLKAYNIEPDGKKFIIIAERHYGDKTFDALDHLMINCNYEVHWI